MKVNLTIITFQRITHAFSHLIVHLTNQMLVHRLLWQENSILP